MNKKQRQQLIAKASTQFGFPYSIRDRDTDSRAFFIQSQTDEQKFIDTAVSGKFWYAADIHQPGEIAKADISL